MTGDDRSKAAAWRLGNIEISGISAAARLCAEERRAACWRAGIARAQKHLRRPRINELPA
jgi:hypothetical protein